MKMNIACSIRSRLKGLLGRERGGGVLVLVPCHDIHTFTMSRPIDVAFVSVGGVVLESYRSVAPFQRLRNRDAAIVLERYASSEPWFAAGDAVELMPAKRAGEGGR